MFTFDGDFVRKPQLDFISEVLKKLGYKGSKVTIEPVGKPGDNYAADVKRIVVKENGGTLKMIAKLADDNIMKREVSNLGQYFFNEHLMYTEILPKFDQLQKSAGVPEKERFRFAKCYGSSTEEPNEVILLEDLRDSNFELLNRFETLSNENVRLVVKNFAVFHALSFVTRYKEPEIYAIFQKQLAPNLDFERFNELTMGFIQVIESQSVQLTDARCEKVLKGSLSNMSKLDAKIRKLAKNSKYTVIQQGDAWTNNVMFRLENNVAVESVLIDYQNAKENSPVFDLMYIIFNSTSHEQRKEHFKNYIDYYHNVFDDTLHKFSLKANLVYPRERLDADMKIYGKYMFASSLLIFTAITKKSEEAEDMKKQLQDLDIKDLTLEVQESALKIKDQDSVKIYKSRVEDLVDSFSEFGFL